MPTLIIPPIPATEASNTLSQHFPEGPVREFIASIGDRRVFAFYGKMGAGKTTFITAVCRELGVTEPVTSPTFAIVNEYTIDKSTSTQVDNLSTIYHFDFYRIRRLEEAYDIGFDDYLDSGALCFIEWPELIEDLLPDTTIRVTIEEDPDTHIRTISW